VTATAARLVLVGGHESAGGADLVRFERLLPGAVAVRSGRRLHDVVGSAQDAGEVVVVVPMTFGRDPTMVADAAKTLRWLAPRRPGTLALTAPFGVADHLTARLRAVAGALRASDPDAALIVTARASNPFDDAELHRVAHLVRAHGAGIEVMVATLDVDAAITASVERLRLLGFARSTAVPAGFGRGLDVDADAPGLAGMAQHGALMSDGAVARIVVQRVEAARHDLLHGRDGIDAGLAADHGHGYAHSHTHDDGPPHDHRHDHDAHTHA
jgi:hypothetical protein